MNAPGVLIMTSQLENMKYLGELEQIKCEKYIKCAIKVLQHITNTKIDNNNN